MKAVRKQIFEIKRMQYACATSHSPYLKNDYEKKIKSMIRDLKEYCSYKKYNYDEIKRINRL